jgi:hypothetical protein
LRRKDIEAEITAARNTLARLWTVSRMRGTENSRSAERDGERPEILIEIQN